MIDVNGKSQHKARKDYVCSVCYGLIKAGTEYIRYSDYTNVGFVSEKRHIHCDALASVSGEANAQPDAYARKKVCADCEIKARCTIYPSECGRVIDKLIAPSFHGAVKRAAREAADERET